MKQVNTINTYLIVFFAILSSGSAIGFIYPGVVYSLYFVTALFGVLLNLESCKTSLNALITLSLFVMFYLLHYAYFCNDSASINSYIGNIMLLFSAFLLSLQISFDSFERVFVNVLAIIAIYSLAMYILGFTFHISQYATGSTSMPILGLYNYLGSNLGRNSGIFWEPGVYQIFLNVAILFLIDQLNIQKLNKKDFCIFLLFAVSIITTVSTTGYIILSCTMMYFVLHQYAKSSISRKIIMLLPLLLVLGSLIFIMLYSPAIYNKLFRPNGSTQIRLNDLTRSPEIIQQSPYWGVGSGTQTEQYRNSIYGITYNSVGVFLSAIRYGCIYICLYIYKIFKGIYKKLFNIRYIMLITMIAVFLTEGMFELAIMYLFIFDFRRCSVSATKVPSNTSERINNLDTGKSVGLAKGG